VAIIGVLVEELVDQYTTRHGAWKLDAA